jgi:hypothetical protein
MTYILFVWMAVAGDHLGYQSGWQNLGTFNGKQLCEDAAKQLGVKAEIYRCVRNG